MLSSLRRNKAEKAFRVLLNTHLDALYRTAWRFLHDQHEAEDAVQTALDKAWRNLGQFDPHTQIKPWVFRILTNTCLDTLRTRSRNARQYQQQADWDDVAAPIAGPEQQLDEQQLAGSIEHAVQKLSGEQQAVVQLIIVEQFSYEEAAQALDLPVGTVRSRLSRARAAIADTLRVSDTDSVAPGRVHLQVVR